MFFYDTHTHRHEIHRNKRAIISVDIRKPFEPIRSTHACYAVGVHPWQVDARDPETVNQLFDKVRQLAILSEIAAIGETGLDKNTAKSTGDYLFQQEIFSLHARLSEAVKKPLIIHCVKAWDGLLHVRQSILPTMPWIIHGFRGKIPLATQLLNTGFYLSFGIHYQIESLKSAWEKRRLLLETDDKNIDIRDVYKQVAVDLSVSDQELANEIQVISSRFPALGVQK